METKKAPLLIAPFSKDLPQPVTFVERTNPITGEATTYGRLRLEQTSELILGSLIVTRKRVAFVTLDALACENHSASLQVGMEFPKGGKIVITETREPQYEGHKPKMNPSTQEYVEVDGEPVYMQQTWTTDLDAQDVLIRNI